MKSKIIGWILIIIFGFNLLFSIFLYFPGETLVSRIPAILFSLVILLIGFHLVRKKKGPPIDKSKPIL